MVVAVEDEGRRVQVRTLAGPSELAGSSGEVEQVDGSGGELYEFVLSPASARFVSAGDAHGPRLEL
jgi:hypothetical protein